MELVLLLIALVVIGVVLHKTAILGEYTTLSLFILFIIFVIYLVTQMGLV